MFVVNLNGWFNLNNCSERYGEIQKQIQLVLRMNESILILFRLTKELNIGIFNFYCIRSVESSALFSLRLIWLILVEGEGFISG